MYDIQNMALSNDTGDRDNQWKCLAQSLPVRSRLNFVLAGQSQIGRSVCQPVKATHHERPKREKYWVHRAAFQLR